MKSLRCFLCFVWCLLCDFLYRSEWKTYRCGVMFQRNVVPMWLITGDPLMKGSKWNMLPLDTVKIVTHGTAGLKFRRPKEQKKIKSVADWRGQDRQCERTFSCVQWRDVFSPVLVWLTSLAVSQVPGHYPPLVRSIFLSLDWTQIKTQLTTTLLFGQLLPMPSPEDSQPKFWQMPRAFHPFALEWIALIATCSINFYSCSSNPIAKFK